MIVVQATPKTKNHWLRTVSAILWSFIGVRKNTEYQQDIKSLHPIHLIIVGLVALCVFVFVLIAAVFWIVR